MTSRKLDEYTKDELLAYIKNLKKQKKFGLVWEDKPEQFIQTTSSDTKMVL